MAHPSHLTRNLRIPLGQHQAVMRSTAEGTKTPAAVLREVAAKHLPEICDPSHVFTGAPSRWPADRPSRYVNVYFTGRLAAMIEEAMAIHGKTAVEVIRELLTLEFGAGTKGR